MVWDGDQLLYEISAPGASGTTAAQMEADTGLAVPFFLNTQHTAVAGWFPYGRVMYEHGGDAPLGVVRMEFSDVLHDPQVIFPFHTWRGSYDGGVTQGQCAYYTTNGTQLAPAPDSTPTEGDTQYQVHANSGYGSTAEHCVTVDWPAAFMLSARQLRRGYAGPDAWMGSLIFESRDASGLYYRRNRYYDSEKQRFTQEDPIGIAGGINVYGFANGDPIGYSDPYGLSAAACCPFSQETGADPREQARNFRETVRKIAWVISDIVVGPEDTDAPNGSLSSPGLMDPVSWFSGFVTGGYSVVRGAVTTEAASALRPSITTLDDIIANPSLLEGRAPGQIVDAIDNSPGWIKGTMQRSQARPDEGLTLRGVNERGNLNGKYIQWHPGGGHHGSNPYWKVSSPSGGTVRIPAYTGK